MIVQRVFDLTESEHEINAYYLEQFCTKAEIKFSYSKLEPHMPMKRLAKFEFEDDMMGFIFLGIFDSTEFKCITNLK